MSPTVANLDAHEQPSDEIRAEWKKLHRLDDSILPNDPRIDDPQMWPESPGFHRAGVITQSQLVEAYHYLGPEYTTSAKEDVSVICHPKLPGLLVLPRLIAPAVQKTLMDRMLHRELSNSNHQTNLHLHYHIPYPEGTDDNERSFFALPTDSALRFEPKNAKMHKPLSIQQVLQKRLHWVTLGGQYDWSSRTYPEHEPPQFPPDISKFLTALFPNTLAQAAIINIYSPGDSMMMHRDVSEETDRGLVSLSFGCDCLFMIAPNGESNNQEGSRTNADEKATHGTSNKPYLVLRLRSGDALYMTKESRYAWHGVPKILKDTCPDYLQDWPAQNQTFGAWQGWMEDKRINLNVRQIR